MEVQWRGLLASPSTQLYTRCIIVSMRTNIVLNDALLAEAQALSRAKSKSALVEEALRTFVAVRARAQMMERYRDGLCELRRELEGARLRASSLELLREDRDR